MIEAEYVALSASCRDLFLLIDVTKELKGASDFFSKEESEIDPHLPFRGVRTFTSRSVWSHRLIEAGYHVDQRIPPFIFHTLLALSSGDAHNSDFHLQHT